MERNFETVMIEQCAPVLASLKPAGLFRYETRDCADLARRVKNWNTQLNPKGLRVRVLKGCVLNHRYLVYVYRESRLAAVLADEKVQSFLILMVCGRRATACRKRVKHRMWAICSLSFPASCAVRQNFRMRSGCSLAIRWAMLWALSRTAARTLPAAAAGSPMATRMQRRSTLTS